MRSLVIFAVLSAAAPAACSGNGVERDAGLDRRASDFSSPRLEAMIEGAARVVRTRGFQEDGVEWRGFLVEPGTDARALSLGTGSCYVVLAVGSSALRELDLRLFDSDGAEVARDAEQGQLAVLRHCPAVSGTYHVAARAAAGSGLFAVRSFRGPAGLLLRVDDVLRSAVPREPEAP